MKRIYVAHWRRRVIVVAVLAVVAGLAAGAVYSGETKRAESGATTGSTGLVAALW